MNPIRIFVVDDNIHARDILKRILNSYVGDFEIVGESATGQGAVIMLEDAQPDVIMLELDMHSETKSPDIIRAIRAANPAVKIVLCSSPTERDKILQAHDDGLMDDFVEKPYIRTKVQSAVRNVVKRR